MAASPETGAAHAVADGPDQRSYFLHHPLLLCQGFGDGLELSRLVGVTVSLLS